MKIQSLMLSKVWRHLSIVSRSHFVDWSFKKSFFNFDFYPRNLKSLLKASIEQNSWVQSVSEYCLSLTKAIVTYARYKVVSASNPGHLVLVEELLDESLWLGVPLHEDDVGGVDSELKCGLPHWDLLVEEEEDEGDERERVEGAIAEQRPPGQVQHRLGEESAHSDDKLKRNRIRCFFWLWQQCWQKWINLFQAGLNYRFFNSLRKSAFLVEQINANISTAISKIEAVIETNLQTVEHFICLVRSVHFY